MFSVKTRIFPKQYADTIGEFTLLEEARAFAESRFQFSINMWIECDGETVINYEELRRRITGSRRERG